MNRPVFSTEHISPSTESSTESSTRDEISEVFDVATLAGHRLVREAVAPCATFTPVHYEPGYAYPLVVWLHGPSGNEQQLRCVMPLVSEQNYVGVAPRGTHADRNLRGAFDWRQTDDHIAQAESRVFASVAMARRRFHICPRRVFLVGYASGGTMALRIAWNNPRQFAGVATIGGPLPAEFRPLGRVNEMRRLPCMLVTARQSTTYPEHQVCRDLRLLHLAGCKVDMWHYLWGDELNTLTFSELNRWQMALVCASQR